MGGRGSSFRESDTTHNTSEYHRNLSSIEESIREDAVENLIMVDSNGQELYRATGTNDGVAPTEEMIANARDAVWTHNHPQVHGMDLTLGSDDIQTSITLGLREIRAVSHGMDFSLTRNWKLSDAIPAEYKNFAGDYKKFTNQIIGKANLEVYLGHVTRDEADRRINRARRRWLSDHAGDYGWTYREEKKG